VEVLGLWDANIFAITPMFCDALLGVMNANIAFKYKQLFDSKEFKTLKSDFQVLEKLEETLYPKIICFTLRDTLNSLQITDSGDTFLSFIRDVDFQPVNVYGFLMRPDINYTALHEAVDLVVTNIKSLHKVVQRRSLESWHSFEDEIKFNDIIARDIGASTGLPFNPNLRAAIRSSKDLYYSRDEAESYTGLSPVLVKTSIIYMIKSFLDYNRYAGENKVRKGLVL